MYSLSLSFVAIASITYSSAAAAASMETGTGRVSDSEGAAIQGAHLLFHSDPSGRSRPISRSDITQETDALGRFNVQLEPGFYDVCTMAAAFTPQCTKVLVSKRRVTSYNTRLSISTLVTRPLGDTF